MTSAPYRIPSRVICPCTFMSPDECTPYRILSGVAQPSYSIAYVVQGRIDGYLITSPLLSSSTMGRAQIIGQKKTRGQDEAHLPEYRSSRPAGPLHLTNDWLEIRFEPIEHNYYVYFIEKSSHPHTPSLLGEAGVEGWRTSRLQKRGSIAAFRQNQVSTYELPKLIHIHGLIETSSSVGFIYLHWPSILR